MYNEFFGLKRCPFNLTADPEFLHMTAQHREALAGLSYAILARKGLVVLTGTAGTGKTTLLARIMERLPVTRVQSSVILNPTLTPAEFLEAVLMDFGIDNIPATKPQRLARLQNFLWTAHRAGQISALIVDEAHKLNLEVMEEVRLLGNFESGPDKLLQIALVGQAELDDLLNGESLWQFKQRIARRIQIEPLAADELGPYIQHRWSVAGGETAPFSADAITTIFRATQGIPRLINVICDNALIDAFGEDSPHVESRHIAGVCRDLQMSVAVPLSSVQITRPVEPPQMIGGEWAMDGYTMKTLERYQRPAPHRQWFFERLWNKFKTAERTEPA
jgi:type II secretory pathway predicted ATPase ExeA